MPRLSHLLEACNKFRQGRPKTPEDAVRSAALALRGQGPSGTAAPDLTLVATWTMRRARRSVEWAAAFAVISEAQDDAFADLGRSRAPREADRPSYFKQISEDVVASFDPTQSAELNARIDEFRLQLR